MMNLEQIVKKYLPKYNFNGITLNEANVRVLLSMENSSDNIFFTGNAGTGKSTILQLFKKFTTKHTVFLAPTGIAAVNIGGQTIHSFFGFPPKPLLVELIPIRISDDKLRSLKWVDTIVIDEISMCRVDMLEAIDYYLRLHLNSTKPFAGKQMVLVGDMDQLPPVIGSNADREMIEHRFSSPYFFDSTAFVSANFKYHKLTEIYRQDDRKFTDLLDKMKTAQIKQADIEFINDNCYNRDINDTIVICSTNSIQQMINKEKISEINKPVFTYEADITGNFNLNNTIFQKTFSLKIGCSVMCLVNVTGTSIMNGSIGTVVDLKNDSIVVKFGKHGNYTFGRVSLSAIKYEYDRQKSLLSEEEIGTICQFPLKPAYAITIHKSQGQTFDSVTIDLGDGSFQPGMTYVAFSRCKSFDKIKLTKKLSSKDFMYDKRILKFNKTVAESVQSDFYLEDIEEIENIKMENKLEEWISQ